ncbi:hypothetical protein Q2K19_28665 [Micromonospora soli]|uniref:MmyB family transcriptional regulator n=1 Tax=Micromonospora sp. NBRC 110009 TaxID=3061627 RepID=UPI002672C817|nr:hypothetical protein [Micromonospora sp. NBRC 110009]WKT98099.1 hypothetical protein Q2K19_28665 [Micromonospora sp. NBRC 110009]
MTSSSTIHPRSGPSRSSGAVAFAALWSRHPVQTCVSGTNRFRHPVVGEFDLDFEMLHLPGKAGHRLMTYPAAAGSPAEAALRLLHADLSAEAVGVRQRA